MSVVDICERVNATENIRGINYRFSKDGSDVSDESGASKKPMKHNYVGYPLLLLQYILYFLWIIN